MSADDVFGSENSDVPLTSAATSSDSQPLPSEAPETVTRASPVVTILRGITPEARRRSRLQAGIANRRLTRPVARSRSNFGDSESGGRDGVDDPEVPASARSAVDETAPPRRTVLRTRARLPIR